ncbi:MAG: ATP-binding protein [Desulfovibrio sp.]|nr:ATP-binding protein [Desulfovibrio sp.]
MNAETSLLGTVVNSHRFNPLKAVVYGLPGIGKTSFAATFESPILLRTEDGASALSIPTFPKVCASFADVRDAMNALLKERHDYRTLIIDSLDWLEPLMWETVCLTNGKASIEDFGYGKGYVILDDLWRKFQFGLDMLRQKRGMHVICIGHADARQIDPPDSDPYQSYSLKLHKRASALWVEWAEMVLFLAYKVRVTAGKDGLGKNKAHGSGDRVIYTTERPAYKAKTRWPLPDEIYIGKDVAYADFHRELSTATDNAYVYQPQSYDKAGNTPEENPEQPGQEAA